MKITWRRYAMAAIGCCAVATKRNIQQQLFIFCRSIFYTFFQIRRDRGH